MHDQDQPLIHLGTGPEDDMDLGYRVECFESPRIQFPCNAPVGIRPETQLQLVAELPPAQTRSPRWYTIKTAARSLERSFPGAGPTPATSSSDLLNADFGANQLKLQIRDGENNRFIVDIGQGRNFSVLSRGLNASIEAPPGAVRISSDEQLGLAVPAAGPFPFFICDVGTNVTILSGFAPLGGRNGTLTRNYQAIIPLPPSGNTFPIPARAQRVQFSVFAPFGVVTPLVRFASNLASPGAGARILYSTVSLQVGETTTAVIDVPGDASSIAFSPVASLDIMAVWEISW